MRSVFFVLAFSAFALPAAAQSGWGTQGGGRSAAAMGIIEYQSRDWAQCVGGEQVAPQRAIAACGRIIGERVSREVTADAHYYRSLLYRQAGDVERADRDVARALELLEQLVQAEPANTRHIDNLAYLRQETGDFVGAARDFARLAAGRPNDAAPRLRQAEYLFRAGDYMAAATVFDTAATLAPDSAQAQAGRCEARAAAISALDVANAACDEAVRLSNSSSQALFSRGFLNFKRGDIEQAGRDFRAALEADNTNAFAGYGYGVVGVRTGREEQGRQLMAQTVEAVPDVEVYARAGLQP
jgi:tetratricopeptide (TPR) repeat protein